MLYDLLSISTFFKENPVLIGVLAAILAVIIVLLIAIIVLQVKGKKRRAEEKAQKAAAAGAPEGEVEPELYTAPAEQEVPAEQPAPTHAEDIPAEQPAPTYVEAVPAEEPAPEPVEEAPDEEPAPTFVEAVPAEEEATAPAEEVFEEASAPTFASIYSAKPSPMPVMETFGEPIDETEEEPALNAEDHSKEEKSMKKTQQPAQTPEPAKKGSLVFKPSPKKEPVPVAPTKPAPVKPSPVKPVKKAEPAKAAPAKKAEPVKAAPAKKAEPAKAPAKKEQVSAANGKWVIEYVKGKYWFSLIAPNGQVMLESAAPYATLSSAKNGIKTYRENIVADHLEIVEHKNGDSQVQILNGSGRLLATSSTYSTRSQAESARDSIKRWAPTDAVEDPD